MQSSVRPSDAASSPVHAASAFFAICLLFSGALPATAQHDTPVAANDQPVSFPPVTRTLPSPLLSASGRFSSLNPPNQVICHNSNATGRVVSARLIRVDQFDCDDYGSGLGYHGCCSLMNVELSDSADAEKMVIGKRVTIKGTFKNAFEYHDNYPVNYLIAKNARILYGDPFDRSAALVQDTTSFIMCEPQQLDALSTQLGRELCVQSTIVANLNVAGPALETAARSLVQHPTGEERVGDLNAITCRLDPEHTDAHLQAAVACARNSYWAWWVGKQRDPVGYGKQAPP